jgi:hypothetical protein
LTISFDDINEYPNVKDMIKITNILKPGSNACWKRIKYNEVALLIYLSSPHVQLQFPNLSNNN